MPTPLLVVDVQNGFINEYTHHIPQRVVALLERGAYEPVLFTRFVNCAGGPYHTILDWHACEREPETNLVPQLTPYAAPDRVFEKLGLAGMPDELAVYLREHKIEEIAILGIDTDMCVLKLAMDAFDRGVKPIVLTDCCASTAGLQAHFAGLAVLSRNIGAQQLREAGLSGGSPAAPKEPADEAA
jgi:nicotinamidase-related amidase